MPVRGLLPRTSPVRRRLYQRFRKLLSEKRWRLAGPVLLLLLGLQTDLSPIRPPPGPLAVTIPLFPSAASGSGFPTGFESRPRHPRGTSSAKALLHGGNRQRRCGRGRSRVRVRPPPELPPPELPPPQPTSVNPASRIPIPTTVRGSRRQNRSCDPFFSGCEYSTLHRVAGRHNGCESRAGDRRATGAKPN